MKVVYKRSSAATALAMPEEAYASGTDARETDDRGLEAREPAPAGALHRVFPPGQGSAPEPEGDAYIPQRGSYGMRVRGGIPRSVAGRVLLACGASAVLATVALAAAGVRSFLLHDQRFLLSSSSAIAINGNDHISRNEVLGVFGVDLERNIFKAPLAERRADLERLPWVEQATVMRLLPNHLRVEIKERTPVAFTRQGTQIGLVDGSGVMLDMPPQSAGDPHYSFPVLTGLALNDTPSARAARMEVYRRFLSELASAGPKVTQSLSEVDVTSPEDVKALITTGDSDILVHFGDENFLGRYQAFQRHFSEWHAQYPRLASADMRYERQVVLEMQPDGSTPPGSSAIAPVPAAKALQSVPKKSAAPAHRPATASARHTTGVRSSGSAGFQAKLAAEHRAALNRERLFRR